MDLGAYVEIDKYEEIAKKNGISVPRLRGYRLMKDEHCIASDCKQIQMFNTYCGRKDVLMIHARIGSTSWASDDADDVKKQPWYLDMVDDDYDSTYCDIYAKIQTP